MNGKRVNRTEEEMLVKKLRSKLPLKILAALVLAVIIGLSGTAAAGTGEVVAYYFHGAVRCKSCMTIEAYSDEALQEGFSKELTDGRLEWKVVNIQEEGNQHFADDYKLISWSLILVDGREGKEARWKNLDKIWELIRDKEKFKAYVQGEVGVFLQGE